MLAGAFRTASRSVARFTPNAQIASRNFATYKSSTGLVGLSVDPNGRETLQDLAQEILVAVKKIPESSEYRQNVEKWFTFIAKVTAEKHDIKAIEKEIDLGQIEEVIAMAKDERELVDYYYEEKGWERLAAAKKEADLMAVELADTIYFSNNANRKKVA